MIKGEVNPARQSLGRPLFEVEQRLADALLAIFATKDHDFESVVQKLNSRGVARPSGDTDPWSVLALEQELQRVNRSLDDIYEGRADAANLGQ